MSDAESAAYPVLARLLESRTGQQLGQDRAWRIDTALKPLLRELAMSSADQLLPRLVYGRDPAITERVTELLLNRETSFLRDPMVFEAIAKFLEERSREHPGRRLRILSVGCSNGQEPLSIAMQAATAPGGVPLFPDIVATDVSAEAIRRAKAGRYTQFEIQRGLPIRLMLSWFDQTGDDWIAKPDLLGRISYRRQNVLAEPMPAGSFDLILCRNVLLYFPEGVRRQAFERLARALRPDGLLLLGAGETVIGQTQLFEPSRTHRGFYTHRPASAPVAAGCA